MVKECSEVFVYGLLPASWPRSEWKDAHALHLLHRANHITATRLRTVLLRPRRYHDVMRGVCLAIEMSSPEDVRASPSTLLLHRDVACCARIYYPQGRSFPRLLQAERSLSSPARSRSLPVGPGGARTSFPLFVYL